MSAHYDLAVAIKHRATRAAKALLKRACSQHGLTHASGHEAIQAARNLSNEPCVDRVVITYVTEQHESTWREGFCIVS